MAKSLESITFFSRRGTGLNAIPNEPSEWISCTPRGDFYEPSSMAEALARCIKQKITKYSAKPGNVTEFYLLVHYDKAWRYNSPVSGLEFSYAEAVNKAAVQIGNETGMFDNIFVFVPLSEEEQVFLLNR